MVFQQVRIFLSDLETRTRIATYFYYYSREKVKEVHVAVLRVMSCVWFLRLLDRNATPVYTLGFPWDHVGVVNIRFVFSAHDMKEKGRVNEECTHGV